MDRGRRVGGGAFLHPRSVDVESQDVNWWAHGREGMARGLLHERPVLR